MTVSSLFDPWEWCRKKGVRVEHGPISGTGLWIPERRVIVLHKGMTRRQQWCCLAHECAHVALGHWGHTLRQERQADEWAAARLITPEMMERAEHLVGHSTWMLADELDVTPWVIVTWREMFERAA